MTRYSNSLPQGEGEQEVIITVTKCCTPLTFPHDAYRSTAGSQARTDYYVHTPTYPDSPCSTESIYRPRAPTQASERQTPGRNARWKKAARSRGPRAHGLPRGQRVCPLRSAILLQDSRRGTIA